MFLTNQGCIGSFPSSPPPPGAILLRKTRFPLLPPVPFLHPSWALAFSSIVALGDGSTAGDDLLALSCLLAGFLVNSFSSLPPSLLGVTLALGPTEGALWTWRWRAVGSTADPGNPPHTDPSPFPPVNLFSSS